MRASLLACLVALSSAVLSLMGCGLKPEEVARPAPAERKPDVILVVIDALRRDHLGLYGHDRPTSPTMDGLGDAGIVFENAYSHGSQTFNSTASLLTSRYFPYLLPRTASEPIPELEPQTAARHSRVPVLAESNVTLAEAVREGGYQTVGIFTNPHHHSSSGFWQGFDTARYLPPEKGDVAYGRAPKIYQAFFDWFENERQEGPYFAYLHFMDVHSPYRPPRFLRKQFVTVKGRDLYRKGIPEEHRLPTATDLQYMMELYDAEIRFVDIVIGELARELESRGRSEDTVLIVTSDHGDEFMDHGGLGHGSHLERELIHIPLLISGLRAKPRRETGLTRHIDVAPTITEIAGFSSPSEFQGISLVPLIQEPDRVDLGIDESFAAVADLRSLTTQDWHFTFNPNRNGTRLYQLESDPAGHQDVSDEHPEVVNEFLEKLATLAELEAKVDQEAIELSEMHPQPREQSVDPEVRDQLEALGYIDP